MGENTYKCSQCNKTLMWEKYHKKIIKIGTMETQYTYKYCGKYLSEKCIT